MPFYVRKVARAKWEKQSKDGVVLADDPDADAITGCTKTTDNTLSLWLIDDDSEEQIKHAAIVFAAAFPKNIETFHLLMVDKKDLDDKFKIENTPAHTVYKKMDGKHYDILELKYSSLKTVAEVIVSGLNANKVVRISKANAIEYLKEAIKTGTITIGQLPEYMHKIVA